MAFRLINFFRKPTKVRVIRRDESKLRLADWQLDAALCSVGAKVLDDPNMRLMMSVLKNEHPANHVIPYGASMDDRVVHQARAEGYGMALANLEAMARNVTMIPMPDVVFEREG